MEPLISVIIPVYNMEQYLERCLDSVIGNTYRNLEILCVDDGSTDRSLEILRAYEEKDSRIIVIAKENGGVSSARNAGLDRMTGEFVTFIDSDDFVHPQFFEILFTVLQISGAEISIGDYSRIPINDELPVFSHYTILPSDVQKYSFSHFGHSMYLNSYIGNKMFSSAIIGGTRFPLDVSYGEDTLFLLSLCEAKPDICFGVTQFSVYFYCQGRSDSLAQIGRDKGVECFLSILFKRASEPEHEKIYLEPAIKRCLYFRYYYTFISKKKTLSKALGRLMRPSIRQLLISKNYSVKDKAFWTLFILSSRIDRLHRFYREPSLKDYEQLQKAALAAERAGTFSKVEEGKS